MTLRETVEKYRDLAGSSGGPVALADFGLPPQETEQLFGHFDEDYHISRFFHFSLDAALKKAQLPVTGNIPTRTYKINDFAQSHVLIDSEIAEIL
jgi:hypothetical protein